jgi:hypothetical protein
MKLFHDLKSFGNKAGFEDQVLGRISRDHELRRQDNLSTGSGQAVICMNNLLKIALQISNNGIELRKSDFHAALRRLCVTPQAAILFCPLRSLLKNPTMSRDNAVAGWQGASEEPVRPAGAG